MKIYLARHGQSQWQVAPSNNLNSSLTAIGHEQSKRMGQWLANHRLLDNETQIEVTSLWVSPLKRAFETASYVGNALCLPLVTQKNLSEADFRVADHLPRADTPFHNKTPYNSPKVYADFKSKVKEALSDLIEQAEANGETVLVITHGGVIETMLRLIVASDTVRFQPYNAALTLIEWKDGLWHLVQLNFWDYLPIPLRTF